eukprot:365216-Chlamydomonas_euryale.AAC.6
MSPRRSHLTNAAKRSSVRLRAGERQRSGRRSGAASQSAAGGAATCSGSSRVTARSRAPAQESGPGRCGQAGQLEDQERGLKSQLVVAWRLVCAPAGGQAAEA